MLSIMMATLGARPQALPIRVTKLRVWAFRTSKAFGLWAIGVTVRGCWASSDELAASPETRKIATCPKLKRPGPSANTGTSRR